MNNDGAVHIWTASIQRLHLPPDVLSEEEKTRAASFFSPQMRAGFVAVHVLLRRVLAVHTGMAPAKLPIAREANGKPFLAGFPQVQFNLAYSDSVALWVVTTGRAVGIDVERIDETVDIDTVVDQYFDTSARRRLDDPDAGSRIRCFYAWWVRKEALLKASGRGLADLDRVFVPEPGPGQWSAAEHAGCSWKVVDLPVCPAYAAAVAVQGHAEDPANLALHRVVVD